MGEQWNTPVVHQQSATETPSNDRQDNPGNEPQPDSDHSEKRIHGEACEVGSDEERSERSGGAPTIIGETVLDRYRVESFIASGGHGDVYAAVDIRILGRRVAVKVPCSEHYPLARNRLIHERVCLGKIASPNVVRILDVGRCSRGPIMVMELLVGKSLQTALREPAEVVRGRVASISYDLACALAACHAAGLAHLDVSPDNVMLEVDVAGNETAKLIDFGRATDADRLDDETTNSLSSETLRFRAPEVKLGFGAGPASDIYSLGMLVGEMDLSRLRAGTLAHRSSDVDGKQHRTDGDLVPDVQDPLWRLAQSCVDGNPQSRPTALELVATLRDIRCACPTGGPNSTEGQASERITGEAGR